MSNVFVVDGDDAVFDEEVVADGGVFFDFFDEWRGSGFERFFLIEFFLFDIISPQKYYDDATINKISDFDFTCKIFPDLNPQIENSNTNSK